MVGEREGSSPAFAIVVALVALLALAGTAAAEFAVAAADCGDACMRGPFELVVDTVYGLVSYVVKYLGLG